jgi:hypothetical protein
MGAVSFARPARVFPMAKSRPLPAEVWSTAADPAALLRHLREHMRLYRAAGHRRKLRLLGCAAARAVWPALPNDAFREAVVEAEKHADTEVRRTALQAAAAATTDRRPDTLIGFLIEPVQSFLSLLGMATPDWSRVFEARTLVEAVAATTVGHRQALAALRAAARLAVAAAGDRWNEGVFRRAEADQSDLVRDLFGDPFRPAAFDPRWRTAAALGLARAAHAGGAFDRLPILADALEEAGCDDPAVLNHCRGGGPHARGCWVVDGLLGRGVTWK